jgi:predicted MPP superfamily phosphohydrolase
VRPAIERFMRLRRSRAVLATADFFIADMGPHLDGFTIGVLSDLHHGPAGDLAWLRHAVDAVNARSPDIIALLGDYGSSFKRAPALSRAWYRKALIAMAPECRRLRARHGVVAVLGNHDYYAGAADVGDWLRGVGAEVLVNRALHVCRGEGALRIAGMDDLSEGRPDAYAGCDPGESVPTVVLSHNPDGVMHLAADLRVDVMLAGHTHGGQIVIPGFGAPITMSATCARRSAAGWIPNTRVPLYVTRGLGAQLPLPIRVNCRPEVFVLRLRAGSQHPA